MMTDADLEIEVICRSTGSETKLQTVSATHISMPSYKKKNMFVLFALCKAGVCRLWKPRVHVIFKVRVRGCHNCQEHFLAVVGAVQIERYS